MDNDVKRIKRKASVKDKPVPAPPLSEEERRKKIITLIEVGDSAQEISSKLSFPYSTVKRVVKKYKEIKSPVRNPGSGRPSLLEPEDLALIKRLVDEDPKISAPKIAGQIWTQAGKAVSENTVRRALKSLNFSSCIAASKPLLSPENKALRYQCAKEWSRWPLTKLYRIIFSDESRFTVFGNDGKTRVWRQPGTRLHDKNCRPTVKGNGGSVMFWGCITYKGVGEITAIDGNLDRYGYTRVLSTHLHKAAAAAGLGRDFIFQQDNATCHKAEYTMEFFDMNKVELLDWPAQSPDLNPIEIVWAYIGKKLSEIRIRNKAHLIEEVTRIWKAIPDDYIRSLYDGLPKRYEAAVRAKGGHINY